MKQQQEIIYTGKKEVYFPIRRFGQFICLSQNCLSNIIIFSFLGFYYTAKFCKTAAKGLFTVKIVFKNQTFMFWTVNRRENHNSKKAQHKDFLSSTYYKYEPKLGAIGKPFELTSVEYQQCQTQ